MADYMKFFDTVEFKPLEVQSVNKKDNFGIPGASNQPLVVKIAATHSGLITRNNGFYLPDRMRKGATSFTAQYGKPIQVHHNDTADAVGRVLKAEYVDISAGVHDTLLNKILNSSKLTYNDQFIEDFLAGKASYMQSVNFISDAMNHSDSILDDPNYKGLGYIELTASISDPDAKQKVLDGRYLTGSVGVSTNRAICSVCKQDWIADGARCEHKPGKVYDGAKAFMITGDLSYDEYSFVNTPADRHSGILEINIGGIKDSLVMESSFGRSLSVDIITDNIDSKKSEGTINNRSQEATMNEKVKELLLSIKSKFELVDDTEVENILKTFENVDIKVLDEIDLAVDVEARLDRISVDKIFALPADKKLDALKALRPFAEDTGLVKIAGETFESTDAFYNALNDLEWNDYSETDDEALIAYLAEHAEDAKLSTAQRKRLPGSAFCGPNKSFPVPDKAHVTAARRLVGRASVSAATKQKILACVNRKATAMGASKDNTEETVVADKTQKPAENVETIDTLTAKLATVETQLKEVQDKLDALTSSNTELSTVKANLDTANAELTKALDATREELKLTQVDLVQMADQLVTLEEKSISLLIDKVALFTQLTGSKIEDSNKFISDLANLGEVAIKDQLSQLSTKVDMNKITDSINSGLTRNPSGTIQDPTINLQDQTKPQYTKDSIKKIADEYMRLQLGGSHPTYGRGPSAAEKFKQDMRSKGLIPNG